MKLYDKKFLIYGNCMIRSFGQPGFQVILFNSCCISMPPYKTIALHRKTAEQA